MKKADDSLAKSSVFNKKRTSTPSSNKQHPPLSMPVSDKKNKKSVQSSQGGGGS